MKNKKLCEVIHKYKILTTYCTVGSLNITIYLFEYYCHLHNNHLCVECSNYVTPGELNLLVAWIENEETRLKGVGLISFIFV